MRRKELGSARLAGRGARKTGGFLAAAPGRPIAPTIRQKTRCGHVGSPAARISSMSSCARPASRSPRSSRRISAGLASNCSTRLCRSYPLRVSCGSRLMPHELTPVQRLELVRGFVRAAFVDDGMVADIALHEPGGHGDNRNHHAHILLTMRRIEGESFGAKERAWNAPALLEQWRAMWADHVNRALARAGEQGCVDHRSLEAQGIERLAQIHLGPAAIEMQRRGVTTDRADRARAIAAINTRLSFDAARREAAGARQAPAAPKPPARAQSASTAPQSARQPPNKISGVSALFRRLGRALTAPHRAGDDNATPQRKHGRGIQQAGAEIFVARFADMRQDFKARAAITRRGIRIDPQAYEARGPLFVGHLRSTQSAEQRRRKR